MLAMLDEDLKAPRFIHTPTGLAILNGAAVSGSH
jgi:hypothetical protein